MEKSLLFSVLLLPFCPLTDKHEVHNNIGASISEWHCLISLIIQYVLLDHSIHFEH